MVQLVGLDFLTVHLFAPDAFAWMYYRLVEQATNHFQDKLICSSRIISM